MDFAYRIPRPPLGHFVGMIWEWSGPRPAHALEALMPTAEGSLVVNLMEDVIRVYEHKTLRLTGTHRGAAVLGAYSEPSIIDSAEQEHVFGIQFRAGGGFAFFGMPFAEVTNRHVGLEDLWKENGLDLRIELLEAPSSEARFDTAERYLSSALRFFQQHAAVGFALREIAERPSEARVLKLADRAGISARRFIELFKDQVGLTPKSFARVKRFQLARTKAHTFRARDMNWASLATECGYYDQAHLIHEFAEMAGMRPTEYLTRVTEHPNHVRT